MVVKTCLVLSFLYYTTSMYATDSFSFQADEWFTRYAATASDEDLQFLANSMYISWQRYEATKQAQNSALELLDHAWRAWYAIAYTRRNPSHSVAHDCTPNTLDTMHRRFYAQYQRYRLLNRTYDTMLTIAKEYHSLDVQQSWSAAKSNARVATVTIMRHALELFNSQSGKAYQLLATTACKAPTCVLSWFGSTKAFGSLSSLGNLFSYHLAPAAIQTFALFDNNYVAASDRCWQAFLRSQQASNLLWDAVTNTLAHFYKAHYAVLYTAMKQRNLASHYFNVIFDSKGFIPENRRKSLLPIP